MLILPGVIASYPRAWALMAMQLMHLDLSLSERKQKTVVVLETYMTQIVLSQQVRIGTASMPRLAMLLAAGPPAMVVVVTAVPGAMEAVVLAVMVMAPVAVVVGAVVPTSA